MGEAKRRSEEMHERRAEAEQAEARARMEAEQASAAAAVEAAGAQPAPATENPTIVITMLPDGNVTVNAPFENQILCRGLLSCAEDVVRMMGGKIQQQRRQDGIQVVRDARPWYKKFAK